MKNITSSINGLASSLLLNVGLTQVAQKLDPITQTKPQTVAEAISAEYCVGPSEFGPETGI